MKRVLVILASLLVVVGCASEHAPAQTAAALRREPVAAAFCMNAKRIHYSELVYKVLYNETVTHDSVFDGLWDVDSELSVAWAKLLPQAGIHSRSIIEVLPSSELPRDWCRKLEDTSKPQTLSAPIQKALLERQIRYLMVLRAYQFTVASYSIGSFSQLTIQGELAFHNVGSNRQEFSEHVSMGVSLGSRPPRELEANDMAWLKQTALELLATQSLKWTRSALEAD